MSRTLSRPRRLSYSIAAVSALGIALTGCSSGSDSATDSSSPSSQQSASPEPSAVPASFKSTVTSVRSWVSDVGKKKDGQQTYGVNILEGTTQINDVTVRVRNMGTVDYTEGSGDFGGFVELVWSDGTTLGMRQNGAASFDESSEKTTFEADLEVINGSGSLSGTTGTGNWTGNRKASLGGAVVMKVTLDLVNAPKLITGEDNSRNPTPTETYSATIAP